MKHQERRRGATGPMAHAGMARARRRRLIAIIAIVVTASAGTVAGQPAPPAFAIEYPTWDDVQNARGNEAAKKAEIDRIIQLLAQLQTNVVEAQALSVRRGDEYYAAQLAFDEADFKARQLQSQADAAQGIAAQSKLKAGQLAARLSRTGGGDVSASLFFDGASATDLLSQLGMASKITDQSAGIYAKAVRDQNTAQSLTDQANVAKTALQALAAAAAAALKAATDAADAAAAALVEQQQNEAQLQAQLLVLTENRVATEADYQAGVRAREAAAAAARAAAAAAAAAARAAAAAAASAGRLPAGQISGSGWAQPVSGFISSAFGNRIHPITGIYTFHAGVDIAAGCGQPIFAAGSGTVSYSGSNGGYGLFVAVDSGDVTTSYAHNGSLLVSRGQSVSAGDLIALVGSTGNSTGCHSHFEVRVGGGLVDPVAFMGDRGIPIG